MLLSSGLGLGLSKRLASDPCRNKLTALATIDVPWAKFSSLEFETVSDGCCPRAWSWSDLNGLGYPKQHLNRFSRFSTAHGHGHDQQTNRRTQHAATVTIGRILSVLLSTDLGLGLSKRRASTKLTTLAPQRNFRNSRVFFSGRMVLPPRAAGLYCSLVGCNECFDGQLASYSVVVLGSWSWSLEAPSDHS